MPIFVGRCCLEQSPRTTSLRQSLWVRQCLVAVGAYVLGGARGRGNDLLVVVELAFGGAGENNGLLVVFALGEAGGSNGLLIGFALGDASAGGDVFLAVPFGGCGSRLLSGGELEAGFVGGNRLESRADSFISD